MTEAPLMFPGLTRTRVGAVGKYTRMDDETWQKLSAGVPRCEATPEQIERIREARARLEAGIPVEKWMGRNRVVRWDADEHGDGWSWRFNQYLFMYDHDGESAAFKARRTAWQEYEREASAVDSPLTAAELAAIEAEWARNDDAAFSLVTPPPMNGPEESVDLDDLEAPEDTT